MVSASLNEYGFASSAALSSTEKGDGGGDISPKLGGGTSGTLKLGASGSGDEYSAMGGISTISGSRSRGSPESAAFISSSDTYMVFSGSASGRSRTSSGSAIGGASSG